LQAEGIPTVSVFLSGRPLWVNPELNASDAFVAAWLPGSEGGGIADVLIGDIDGRARHDFKGKLSFSWPKSPEGEPLNVGDVAYDPLFAYGYGLTYAEQFTIGRLDDSASTPLRRANANAEIGFGAGVIQSPWRLTQTSNVTVSRRDRFAQEDSLHAVWSARGTLALEGPPQDFTRQTNADMALEIVYHVHEPPAGKVELQFDCGEQCEGGLDITNAIQAATKARWLVSRTSLSCFATRGTDVGAVTRLLGITSTADLELSIHSVRIVQNPGDANCEFEVVSE
jgi:beta-glucosidase